MARVAVVTGGNRGIGFGIVRALCKKLDNGIVYLTARDEAKGKAAVEELKKEGLNPRFHQLDITDQESIDRLRDHLMEEHGGLDILINNAAIAVKPTDPDAKLGYRKRLFISRVSYDVPDYSIIWSHADPAPIASQAPAIMATNFYGTLAVCHSLFPIIRSYGRVCHVASITGEACFNQISKELKKRFEEVSSEEGLKELMQEYTTSALDGTFKKKGWVNMPYGTSKLGVVALNKIQARDIRLDTSRENILINCCHPGYVATDMTNNEGSLTIDQGADYVIWQVLVPHGTEAPHGYFYNNYNCYNFLGYFRN